MTLAGAALVAGVVGVVVAEGALRLYARRNRAFLARLRSQDLLSVKVVPMGEFGFRQRPNTSLRYENGTVATANAMGYRGPEVPLAKPANTTRIVLAGGSSTHGWAVRDDQTLDAYMRRELGARYPGRRFEVVNLAFDGYDSFQDYERIRLEGMRLDPDVIILNNGINDIRNARYPDLGDPDPRTLLWRDVVRSLRAQEARGGPTLKTRAKHLSYLLRFVGVVRATWHHELGVAERTVGEQPDPNPEAFDYFERNVRRTAALATERDIALLLSTSPSSIPANYPPDATSPRDYWIGDAAQTQRLRDAIDERMRRVATELGAAGHRVAYAELDIPPSMFLDDAHLSPDGNEALARAFCDAVAGLIDVTTDASTNA